MNRLEEMQKQYKEWEESINNMSAEEMKADLLNNCELSFTDSRKLKRNIADGLLRKMYKAYHPFVNPAEEGYNFIMRKYEGLLKSLYELFDIEDYSLNIFDRLNEAAQYSKEDLSTLERERIEFRKEISTEILAEFNNKYNLAEVEEYAGDSLNFAVSGTGYSTTFSKAFKSLTEWAEAE